MSNHIAEAVRLLERSKTVVEQATARPGERNRGVLPQHAAHEAHVLAAQAQVHATLALVQATVG